ncbi:hypothetical protein EBU71_06275 [bacterium]|nr:hypothetical protein [Candidatus Elulimicrobium humile]
MNHKNLFYFVAWIDTSIKTKNRDCVDIKAGEYFVVEKIENGAFIYTQRGGFEISDENLSKIPDQYPILPVRNGKRFLRIQSLNSILNS